MVKASYGSDELESAAFVRREAPSPEPSSTHSRRRVALATGALVVTLGAALLALHSTASSSHAFTASTADSSDAADAARLQAIPSYVVPPVLQTGREFSLRMKGKNDLCLDDSGAVSAGQAKLAPWPCNPSNANQLFVYNTTTYQLRSARKPGLCLDASATLQLQNCNPTNANQRFTYNPTTFQIRAAAKATMCLDDNSATRAGATRFIMFSCDPNSANQRVEVVFRDDAAADQQRVIDAAQDGSTRFQIRAVGKSNLCVDDGGATSPDVNAPALRLATCDSNSANQLWVWDLDSKRVRSATKPGLCLDDGGVLAAGSLTRMSVAACNAASKSQDFAYDKALQGFRNPSKPNLCMDDGTTWPQLGVAKIGLGACDTYNANQHFAYVPVPPPASDETPALLRNAREFSLSLPDTPGLCLDDGGASKPGESSPGMWPCNPSNDNQAFVYDAKTNQIRSARKANLCLDDGGMIGAMTMNRCDPYNPDQRFAYDDEMLMFKNPLKPGLCLDDGGGERAGETQAGLRICDDESSTQRFDVTYRDEAQEEQQSTLDAVAAGAKFFLRIAGKDNLCIDDGGATKSGGSQMGVSECEFEDVDMDQVFMWDATTKRIRSFTKKGLCVDDGGATMRNWNSVRMTLVTCDATSTNQAFTLDKTQLQLRNPNKPALCVDDGGAWTPTYATIQLAPCDLYSANQHIEYVLLPPLPVYDTPPELQTDREFLLRIRGKNSLCVDDGGGSMAGETKLIPWACNPSNDNQAFVYDAKTNQIRSARKPTLCVDDAGATRDGAQRLVMGDCDKDSRNQRFVYDAATQMFRNPTRRNMCIDDGGASRGGGSQLTTWTCADDSPNQHFQIKFRDEWQIDQQRVIDAVMLHSARFQIRAVGKKSLCVDDGGGTTNGATQMWLTTCDPRNANQVFVWDAAVHHIRSASKGLCVDDVYSGPKMWLWSCDATNKNQDFVYDKKLQAIRNPSKTNMCFDDGGTWAPSTARMLTLACDVYNTNQRFELVPVA